MLFTITYIDNQNSIQAFSKLIIITLPVYLIKLVGLSLYYKEINTNDTKQK